MNNINTTQENIMLIAHKVTTKADYLGNGLYITTPWVMSERKLCDFYDGVISLHNSKADRSYIAGRITNVINIGAVGGRNRVAFVFKRFNKTIRPEKIRSKFEGTISETREQVRY
jgi:hypothetical protein